MLKKLLCLDTWFREGGHLKRALKETKLYGSDVRAMLSANAKARGAQVRPDDEMEFWRNMKDLAEARHFCQRRSSSSQTSIPSDTYGKQGYNVTKEVCKLLFPW